MPQIDYMVFYSNLISLKIFIKRALLISILLETIVGEVFQKMMFCYEFHGIIISQP